MLRSLKREFKGRRSQLLLAAASAAFLPGASALAQTSQWIGGNSADWNTASHWSPSGVPGPSDIVNVTNTLGFTQTISYDFAGGSATLDQVTVNATGGGGSGNETITMSADTLCASIQNIGDSGSGSNGSGTFNQSGGLNSVAAIDVGDPGTLILGVNATDKGVYILSAGSLATATAAGPKEVIGGSGTGVFNQSGGSNYSGGFNPLYIAQNTGSTGTYSLTNGFLTAAGGEYVGNDGTGNFNQSGGSNTMTGGGGANYLDLGEDAGSTGTYTLSGSGSVSVTGPSQEREAIGQNGVGIFNQSGGSNVVGTSGSGVFEIAAFSGSVGTYTLSGGALTVNGSASVAGPLEPFGQGAGGTGTLTVSGAGIMTITGTLTVFDPAGTVVNLSGGTINTGAMNLNGTPSLLNWTTGTLGLTKGVTFDPGAATNSTSAAFGSSLSLGDEQSLIVTGSQTLGGTESFNVSVTGSTNSISGNCNVGETAGSTSSYSLAGAGLLSVSGNENIGDTAAGTFNQTGGTNTFTGLLSNFIVGNNAGATGWYTLSGTGELLNSGAAGEFIGASGIGFFNQTGGVNSSRDIQVGENSGSTGTYTLSATGTVASGNLGQEFVGGSGAGLFNQTGGSNTTDDLSVSGTGPSTGTYLLSGGTLSVGAIYVGGNFIDSKGTGTFTVSSAGQLTDTGTMIVYGSGRVNINGGSAGVGGLSITGGGVVNVNASIAINFGSPANDPINTIVGYLTNGYSGATTWSGTSATSGVITSTSAAGSHTVTLGYLDGNIDTGLPAIAANQILVKYVLVGDSDLSGEVDFTDLAAVLKSFNQSGTDWAHGNFEYAANNPSIASTNFNDLADVLKNFLQTTPGGSSEAIGGTIEPLASTMQIQNSGTQLPEPACFALLALPAAVLLQRRKRRA